MWCRMPYRRGPDPSKRAGNQHRCGHRFRWCVRWTSPTVPTTSPSNTSATRAKPAPSPWTVRSCRPTSSEHHRPARPRSLPTSPLSAQTPVAFSNIKPVQIQENWARSPSMIRTARRLCHPSWIGRQRPFVSIRGFKQRNVSVLVDGIPVNDMKRGGILEQLVWVGLVTQTMRVQRGLGASKLALPTIGGTVNIVTSGIESSHKTSVKQGVGSFDFTRTSGPHLRPARRLGPHLAGSKTAKVTSNRITTGPFSTM